MRAVAPQVETIQQPVQFLNRQHNGLVLIIGRCFEPLGIQSFEPQAEAVGLVSRPEEFHLQPLAEPYVSLSTHTAPVAQSYIISIDLPVHEQRWTRFLHTIEPINTAALVPR